jgi:hypothetical protein
VSGTVNPGGARVKAHFDFGKTAAHGSTTPDQLLPAGTTATGFSAALTGLPAGTTVHYRAVSSSDFGSITGADQTFTTSAGPKAPPAKPGKKAKVKVLALHFFAKGHLLKLKLSVSKPAKVTIRLLAKKKVVRSLTISRKKAGTFTAILSLKGVKPHAYTLRISAKDGTGLQSLAVTRALRVTR